MRRFFQKFFRRDAVRLTRGSQPMFSPQAVPVWSEDYALELAKFLNTHAGIALRLRLQAMVCHVAIAGCSQQNNTTHSAGVGAGWNEAVRKLLEMAEAKRFAPDGNSISGSASATAEKDGQPPDGEAQLLERWSP